MYYKSKPEETQAEIEKLWEKDDMWLVSRLFGQILNFKLVLNNEDIAVTEIMSYRQNHSYRSHYIDDELLEKLKNGN